MLVRAGQSLRGTEPLHKLARQTRSIHIPQRVLQPTNLVHRARAFFTRFTASLQSPSVLRYGHFPPSIRRSLSLPARIALSRPLRAPCLPKAPCIPGNVTHVGFGTARRFSTGRPIFQNIVENVPVAGRAFYEMDWDVKMKKELDDKFRVPRKANRQPKLVKGLRHTQKSTLENPIIAGKRQEFDHYFSAPFSPSSVTYLEIPLAPTPLAHAAPSSEPSPRLLPIPTLAKEHASHSKHSIRVASIFRRLDAVRVWEKGASCETLGDPSGLCTILRIKFEGWTEEMVKSVLGDAGKDWCTIQEVTRETNSTPSLSSTLPRPALYLSTPFEVSGTEGLSFVMPAAPDCSAAWSETKDNNASFSDTETDYSFLSAPHSVWDEDNTSEVSWETHHDIDEWPSVASSPRSQSLLCFSSDFCDRAASIDEWQELVLNEQ